jgi:hypothetical protein
MPQELKAIFGVTVLQPEVLFNLSTEARVKIKVESVVPDQQKPKTFLQTAKALKLQGKPDWSEKY